MNQFCFPQTKGQAKVFFGNALISGFAPEAKLAKVRRVPSNPDKHLTPDTKRLAKEKFREYIFLCNTNTIPAHDDERAL